MRDMISRLEAVERDLRDTRASLISARERIHELVTERDRAQERYDDLLEQCGGVMPA